MRQKAAIIDLDGTLTGSDHRMHFLTGAKGIKNVMAWRQEIDKDVPNQWCIDIIMGLRAQGYTIIYMTGRNEECRKNTAEWLSKYVPGSHTEKLVMRAAKDNRKDTIVKTEIYFRDIIHDYQVVLAIDDRPGVAEMWRELGIVCLHCATWKEEPDLERKIIDTFNDDDKKGTT